MTGLVALGFAAVALAICVMPRPFEEGQEIGFDVRVVDQDTGKPIAAAFLRLANPFDRDAIPPRALSGRDGRARLTGHFNVFGARNAFRSWGQFTPWGRWLEVSATGYRPACIPVTEVLGPFADPGQLRQPMVALVRGRNPEHAFRDLAGRYSQGVDGFENCWLDIEPDGRWAWMAWGGVIWFECGRVKRDGEEIEFVKIPHPMQGTDPEALAGKYRAVAWGARRYLAPMNAEVLRNFCLAGLTPSHLRRPRWTYGGYLLDSDWEKPHDGVPLLPAKVWVKALTDAMRSNLPNLFFVALGDNPFMRLE